MTTLELVIVALLTMLPFLFRRELTYTRILVDREIHRAAYPPRLPQHHVSSSKSNTRQTGRDQGPSKSALSSNASTHASPPRRRPPMVSTQSYDRASSPTPDDDRSLSRKSSGVQTAPPRTPSSDSLALPLSPSPPPVTLKNLEESLEALQVQRATEAESRRRSWAEAQANLEELRALAHGGRWGQRGDVFG